MCQCRDISWGSITIAYIQTSIVTHPRCQGNEYHYWPSSLVLSWIYTNKLNEDIIFLSKQIHGIALTTSPSASKSMKNWFEDQQLCWMKKTTWDCSNMAGNPRSWKDAQEIRIQAETEHRHYATKCISSIWNKIRQWLYGIIMTLSKDSSVGVWAQATWYNENSGILK